MGIIRTFLIGSATFIAGGAVVAGELLNGPGTTRTDIGTSVSAYAGLLGEGADAVPAVVEEVSPAIGRATGSLSGLLPTGTTAPGALSSSEAP